MDNTTIKARPLDAMAFAPFGDIIDKARGEKIAINDGRCVRYHDLARAEAVGEDGAILINIFSSQPVNLPLALTRVERHPLGSQAFMPLSANPFLVIVCADHDRVPEAPQVFVTKPGQGINLKRNVWHGVLAPLYEPADFLVIDRGPVGGNLEEYDFARAYKIIV